MNKEIIDINNITNDNYLENLNIIGAVLYYIDKVEVYKNPSNISLDNLIEGRLFGDKNEIKIIKNNGELKTILIQEEDEDEFIKRAHKVVGRKFDKIHNVCIKEYVSYDEDGQAYISYWRPYKLI